MAERERERERERGKEGGKEGGRERSWEVASLSHSVFPDKLPLTIYFQTGKIFLFFTFIVVGEMTTVCMILYVYHSWSTESQYMNHIYMYTMPHTCMRHTEVRRHPLSHYFLFANVCPHT